MYKKEERSYIQCVRGLRFILLEKQVYPEIEKYKEAFAKAFTLVSKHVFDNYPNMPSYSPKYVLNESEKPKKFLHNTIVKEIKELIETCGITSHHRNVVMAVLANYQSYRKRNKRQKRKFPSTPIKLKNNKSIRFDDGGVVIGIDGTISIPGLNGNRINSKFVVPGTSTQHLSGIYELADKQYHKKENALNKSKPNRKKHKTKKDTKLSATIGGTLFYDKIGKIWRFVAAVEKKIKYQYKPEQWVGTDFNDSIEHWIYLVFEDDTNIIVTKPANIDEIENEISKVNDILNDCVNTTGGIRRYHNNLRIKLHKKHKELVRPYVKKIVQKLIEKKYGISIDDVKTGQSRGTWGQDKLTKLMIAECENQGVPFYVSNPAYTSITCSGCGHVSKGNRKGTGFECELCGITLNAHVNGARNTRLSAIRSSSNVSEDNVEEMAECSV